MTPFKWFLSYLKKYRIRMFVGLFLVFVNTVLVMIDPHIAGMIVDDVIIEAQYDILPKLLLILVGLCLARCLFRYIFLMQFEMASQGMLYTLRYVVYAKMMKEDFSFYNKHRTGDLMSRQTGDMEAIRRFVAFTIYATLENVCWLTFALFMLFSVNAKLALCMIAVLPITILCVRMQSKQVKPAFERNRQCFSRLNTFAQENISGNRVVKAFAKEDFEAEKFTKENDAFRDAQIGASKIWAKFIPIFDIMANMPTIILMLVGGIMVVNGEMTLGEMITFNGYLWTLNGPLRMMGWLINDIQGFNTSLEKIYDTYQEEPEVKEPEHPIYLETLKGAVEFKNVDYYAFHDTILRDISFKAEPGQTIGIIGATGSGKSTLTNLISRFYDASNGSVLVDGIDVREMNLSSLRGNIGIAMQDVFLFSDTIEGNIAYGCPDATFEDVVEAAKIANADGFIRKMPEGYDTIVGERGVGLSGGQKQRIALARAILKKPAIVILDDTTSAIDMETEAQIQKALSNVAEQCTVFVIAHRISSVMKADKILVLDNGRIVEQGNHEELIQKKGYYYTVFNHQYGEFDNFKNARRTKGWEA